MEQTQVNDILAAISDLAVLIQSKAKPKLNRSDDIELLGTALAKAQGEYETANLNQTNPYFKSRYADLKSVVDATRPALTKHGLSVTQELSHDDQSALWLITELLHSSGQWKMSRFKLTPPKNDPQSIASYNTYIKRMCYASMVGCVTGDEDDDGEEVMATTRDTFAKGVATNAKYNPKQVNPETITKEQLDDAEYELANYPDICEEMLNAMKIQSLADIPRSKYAVIMRRIREIKLLREAKPAPEE